jgi:hypothetical protein
MAVTGGARYAGCVMGDNIVTRPDPGYHPNPGPSINPESPYQTLDDHSYEEGWWRCGRPLCLTKREKRGGCDMVLVTVDPSVSHFVRGRGEEVRRSEFLRVNY